MKMLSAGILTYYVRHKYWQDLLFCGQKTQIISYAIGLKCFFISLRIDISYILITIRNVL